MFKHIKLLTVCSLGFAAAGIAISPAAQAAPATTSFLVTTTVLKACIVSATPLAFGNYDPTATLPLDATSTLSVLCTIGTPFTVGLSAGLATSPSVTTRRMTNGANTVNYSLYQESTHTNNWGLTPGTDTPASTTAPIGATSMTVYGRVPAGQNVAANAYSDTITVSVNY